MSLGALAFMNPWLLAGVLSLPLIYWLLRTIPPRPKQVQFPPARILVGLEDREKTPSTTPWWLLLIRLLAAALVIFALAEPVLNPSADLALKGSGPVVVVIDNGWAAASSWAERSTAAARIITVAEGRNRPAVVVPTAATARPQILKVEAPADARASAAALLPQPFPPDRMAALEALKAALAKSDTSGLSVLWVSDGIDHDGTAAAFADGLASLAKGGTFAVVGNANDNGALGLAGFVTADGKLAAKLDRIDTAAREGAVHAFSARGARLGEVPFKLTGSDSTKTVTFELPLELRNQVTRLEIANEHSAGAVSLLDSRSQWQRVGLLSGEAQEQSQPLLAPLYYIQKAIAPFAEIVRPKDQNLASGIESALKQQASVLILADIGTLSGEAADRVDRWVKKGGVLVRFAGPRLEKGGDDLLPVPLRLGGRALGGALSWSTPQPLATFEEGSLFAGLTVPSDVTIKRQVLADPARLGPEVKVWARLADGTPLVTAARRGEGQIVLFHVTANSDWSNLPISGLFVEMLRRITGLGGLSTVTPADDGKADTAADTSAAADKKDTAEAAPEAPTVLAPLQTLDGFGILRTPPPTAESVPATKLAETPASLIHPPGYYGAAGMPRAINVITEKTVLSPLPPLPSGAERRSFEDKASVSLKPWLLALALGLILIDILAVILMQTGGLISRGRGAAATVALIAALLLAWPASAPRAQVFDGYDEPDIFRQLRERVRPMPGQPQAKPDAPKAIPEGPDGVAQFATERVTLAYVVTGDTETDNTSKLGLSGLGRILSLRTSVEPNEPMGVNITTDEVAFYPVLYWPVLPDAKALSDAALAKIDAYMKQGGLIIFDTRDYSSGLPQGMAMAGKNGVALQRLIGKLDLPRLEPVPEDHVLTRSFYLLQSFPGRWDGGQLWVEASDTENAGEDRKARRADGVTSIMITSNDFASAWALDRMGRPMYPTVPGGEQQREMSFRVGVNIVMHALTGNYKADQVHVPALLERLGQ